MARSRLSSASLTRLLSSGSLPLYVVDDRRRIVYCNAACGAWAGIAAEELIGQRCDYHTQEAQSLAARIAALLCPPPEALAGQRKTAVVCIDPRRQEAAVAVEFLPLGGDALDCPGVLAIVGAVDLAAARNEQREAERQRQRLLTLRAEVAAHFGIDQLIGDSPAMRRVRRQIELASRQPLRALLVGPPGSGREHVARAIHYGDRRQPAGPLAPLSCALLDAELLQTTITAFINRAAEVPSERPATLLLLDADEMSAEAQRELAGFYALPDFDLHTLATSRRSLIEMSRQGEFRNELACALSTLEIALPALAERRDDLPLLAHYFLEQHNAEGGRQLSGLTSGAVDQLMLYDWPGNIDELAEAIGAACRASDGPTVTAAALPKSIRLCGEVDTRPPAKPEPIVLDELLAEVEAELIRRALKLSKGNKAKAARLLGVSRPRLLRRIEMLKLE